MGASALKERAFDTPMYSTLDVWEREVDPGMSQETVSGNL